MEKEMEKEIEEFIRREAAAETGPRPIYNYLAHADIAYIGLRVDIERRGLRETAKETGCSITYAARLLGLWRDNVKKNDPVTLRLIRGYVVLMPRTPSEPEEEPAPAPEEATDNAIAVKKPPRTERAPHGFMFTEEEEEKMRLAIRSSVRFMERFGRGEKPRLHGEYYAPGTNPEESKEDKKTWLTLESAALYCGVGEDELNAAAAEGKVERRTYRQNAYRHYYEFSVESLDAFMANAVDGGQDPSMLD